MKKTVRAICLILFLALCAGVVCFLHSFTVTDKSMTILNWDSAVVVKDDGTQAPYELYGEVGQEGPVGTYIFKGTLPKGLGNGYLLFEPEGMEIKLSLNGKEIYSSSVKSPEGTMGMAQANLPLPENPEGELVLTCTVTDGAVAMFPPLIRFMPEGLTDSETLAYANNYGIPAGAEAVVLIIAVGLFLLGIIRKKIDWSMIPLIIASSSLILHYMNISSGAYFLPEGVMNALCWEGFKWIAPVALLGYLILNCRKRFWKIFGIATAGSVGILLIGFIYSYATDGYLASYLSIMMEDISYGAYDGLLYWITIWLTTVAVLISAYTVIRSFANQQAEAQILAVRNRLVTDNCKALEAKIRDSAELRHEFRHQLIAIDSLYQKGNYEELGKILNELKEQNSSLAQTQFTENFTVNAILQDISFKTVREKIPFEAKAIVPAKLNIPESDLCGLLMNMLENALEACMRMSSEQEKFIKFHAEVKNGFLAIKCENSYDGSLKKDDKGKILTVKEEPEIHGFGLTQMSSIAQKYHSLLDINYSENNVFTVQTALKIPKKS
ncbi:MAG: ATP-binding protein [Ruminococcus sp.]